MQVSHLETFHKSERLCSLKVISELFGSGETIVTPLFRAVWQISPIPLIYPAQIAISVPKKKFRSAVERNLVKRRIREAYRKNKDILYTELNAIGCKIVFIIIFRGDQIPEYAAVEKNIKELISLFRTRVPKKLKLS